MDLIKKFYPKQKTIQTLKVDTQGFRITINENPPISIFFVKNASNQKPQLSETKIFLVAWLQVSKIAAKLKLEKKIIFRIWYIREKICLQKVGVAAGFL